MKTLQDAIILLRDHGINPTQEVLEGVGTKELIGLLVYWSSITRQAGFNRISDIVGTDFLVKWQGNTSEFRVTVKEGK